MTWSVLRPNEQPSYRSRMERRDLLSASLGLAAGVGIAALWLNRQRVRLPRQSRAASSFLRLVAPSLDGRGHKGQAGRIGVLGGSVDFAGAPYYAGISALRVGAELLYLFTAEEAAGPIKTYSPELMVSTVYFHARIESPASSEKEQQAFVESMITKLPRLHALCIGPGLGRHEAVLGAVGHIILAARQRELPLVIDADGLWLVTQQPELVKGYARAVLTPNSMEYKRLAKALVGDESADLQAVCNALEGTIVLQKGPVDRVFAVGAGLTEPLECNDVGSPRRPGGIGDLLAGSLTTVLAWAALREQSLPHACHAACVLVRRAAGAAYAKRRRALLAPDVIGELGPCFEELCPASGHL